MTASGRGLARSRPILAVAAYAVADHGLVEGPVDLLCNNAGVGHAGAVADTTLEDWRRLVEVELMGVVHGLTAFLPAMLAQPTASHISNTASLAGLVPNPGMVPYSTTKAAVVGLSEALATELRGTSVGVTTLCPGVIDTAIIATSTMRGEWNGRQARAVDLYATRGTSPDVVARHALDGVGRGRVIVSTPRYQTLPLWLLKRASPAAGRAASAAVIRLGAR